MMPRNFYTKERKEAKLCAYCDRPGYRFRANRWQCELHFRADTMRNTALSKGKESPSFNVLSGMLEKAQADGLKCLCGTQMQMTGKRGEQHTISMQHDRSGAIRLICMLCNQRHNDCPGDTFYDLPKDSWRCSRCNEVKKRTEFYPNMRPAYCKVCSNQLSRKVWKERGYSGKYTRKWRAERARG